jgi:hypothetical protein
MEGGVPVSGTAISVGRSLQNRHRVKLPTEVHDDHERVGQLVGNHSHSRVVRDVDEQFGEQESVEFGPISRPSALIQLNRLLQVVEDPSGVGPSGFEGLDGLTQLSFESGPLVETRRSASPFEPVR